MAIPSPVDSSLGETARERVRQFFTLADLAEGAPAPASTRWDLICGESLALLTHVPSGSVQAVVTDSPYSSGGAFRGDRVAATGTKYLRTEVDRANKEDGRFVDFEGDTRDQLSFRFWCALWMAECYRTAEKGAICGFWTDWRQVAATILSMQAGGWTYRGIWVWAKNNARPMSGRPTNQVELVVWGSKGPMSPKRAGGITVPGLVTCASTAATKRGVQTGKPTECCRPWAKLTPADGTLLDPFAGGASLADAILDEGGGRRYLGFEVVPRIHSEAHARLAARSGAPVAAGAAIAGDGQKHGRRRKGGDVQLLLGEVAR